MTDEIVTVEAKDVQLGSISANNPKDVIVQATAIAKELAEIINSRKLYSVISSKKFVKVEGWSTLGAMLGILPREVSVTESESGDFEALVELVRTSDGAVIGRGSAIVGADEPTWKNRLRYARRSMAVTRATGKAFRLGFSWIMTLAGYEPTPAEEMGETEPEQRHEPEHRTEEQNLHDLGYEAKKPATVERPLAPETLRSMLAAKAAKKTGDANANQLGLMDGMLNEAFAPDPEADRIRHSCLKFLWGEASSKKLTGPQIKATLDWLKPTKDEGGAYLIDPMAAQELHAVWTAANVEAGQGTLIP